MSRIPNTQQDRAESNYAAEDVQRVDRSQYVKKTRIWIASHVQTTCGQLKPHEDLRRDKCRTENSGYEKPFLRTRLIIGIHGSLTEVIRQTAGEYDRRADPHLYREVERTPLDRFVGRDYYIGGHQAAKRHHYHDEKKPCKDTRLARDE